MSLGNKAIFAENLKRYIIESGKDRRTVAEDLGFPYSTLTDWINGNKYPRINNIDKLAAYFNVSKSDLIEDFDKIKKDNDAIATIIVKLRTNKDFLEVVEKILYVDKTGLDNLKKLLNAFD